MDKVNALIHQYMFRTYDSDIACWDFALIVMEENGYDISNYRREEGVFKATKHLLENRIDEKDLKPFDIIMLDNKHIMVYIGDGYCLHKPNVVMVDSLSKMKSLSKTISYFRIKVNNG